MLKILQARLQQYLNHELPDVQAGFRKAEEPEIKLPTSIVSLKKQESSRKTSALKRWEYQTTWEICMQVKKQQLEPDMEQQTGSKSGKVFVKAVYCQPVI